MRSRGLVVAIAVVLAVLAAVGVIVYTNQVKDQATTENTTPVLVANQDIATGTQLDPLVSQGVFQQVNIPDGALVTGAVTDLTQLQGKTTSAPIYAHEQIPVARLSGGGGNLLGISEGHVGVGMQVDGPQAVTGLVNVGDNVVIYATFKKGTPVTKTELKVLFTPAQIQKFYDAASGTTSPTSSPVLFMPFDFTTALIPSVKVLSATNPPVDQNGRQQSGSSTFVLDLLPTDAQELIFANESASIWMGLLPSSNADGYNTGAAYGVPIGRVTGLSK